MTPDLAALGGFLDASLCKANDLRVEPVAGGQSNPTFFVRHAGRHLVLRLQPGGPILKGAHAIDREYRVLSALAGTDVPVPKPVLYCSDTTILGTPFYLMERIEGRVFHDASLPGLTAAERGSIYLSMAQTLARLHRLRPDQIGLGDYGRPGNYSARQMGPTGGARGGRAMHRGRRSEAAQSR